MRFREHLPPDCATVTLIEALKNQELTLIWIGGISGIGKTHLAARLYQEVDKQEGYQPLWVDCKKRSVTLEVLLDALARLSGDQDLLESIHDPLIRPEERVQQVLQRFMEPKGVVLFIDDYHRLEGLDEHHRLDELLIQAAAYCKQTKFLLVGQVRPSVLGDPRVRGAFLEHRMKGLAVEYTKEFVGLPGLTDEQAHRIWEQCGSGTPIAMSIFGEELKRRSLSELLALPIWDVANTGDQWLEPVVENLTPSERACLQAASVFPAEIPLRALVYVYDGDDLQSAMDGLLDKGLLDHKPGSDRWSVWHDIIRNYVSEKGTVPLARDGLEQRLVEYYARFVLEYVQKPERLRSESANILGAMDWCKRKQRRASITTTALLQELLELEEAAALQITHSIGELARRSGDLKWAAELFNEVSDLARVRGDLPALAKALYQLARLACAEGRKERLAISRLEESIDVGRTAGEAALDTLARSYTLLGGLLIGEGRDRYALAEQYLLEGRQAARQCKDHMTAARAVNDLVYLYRYDFEKAYSLYCEERVNLSGTPLATLLIGIAPALIGADRFDEAWHCIQEARRIFEERTHLGGTAYTWRLEAKWYWRQGKLELAEEGFRKEELLRYLSVEEKEEEKYHLWQALYEQFWFFLETDQLDKAEQCRARYQAIQPDHDWHTPQMLGHEASALIVQGAFQRASRRCQQAMEIFQEQGNLGGCAWITRIQGNILAAQGELEAAVRLYEEGLELRSRLDEPRYTAEDLEHLAKFYLREMQDVEQARKYLERAQQQFQKVDVRKASAIGERLRALQTE